MVPNMEKGIIFFRIESHTKASSIKTILKEWENCHCQQDNIMECLSMGRWREEDSSSGRMAQNTRAIIKIITSMGLGSIQIHRVKCSRVIGRMA